MKLIFKGGGRGGGEGAEPPSPLISIQGAQHPGYMVPTPDALSNHVTAAAQKLMIIGLNSNVGR